jgi:DNA invertase Pin-like site-specific DNA recombinase
MKSAYLYCRVSTDEQKRKGNSLEEQEDRLIRHCEINGIQIKGIFREDFSAKDFNRPEWKKLIKKIRKNTHRPSENILFIKWDRFSRNIEYAYQMIRLLRDLNVTPMAIDQPIDLEVPESIVMLAVYLSIPEAENARRGRTTSDGLRRARKMGRWPGKAPIGYANRTDTDGKKYIAPKQPEADLIKWSFEQLAKGACTIAQARRMACVKGLQCSKNNFWKLVHNPIYSGIISIPANRIEDKQFIRGNHEPLISQSLFQQVQLIIKKDCNKGTKKDELKSLFPLRTFMSCP